MLESKIQAKIIKYLKAEGYSVFKTVACNRRGISDIIACSPAGRFLALEVKQVKGVVSPLQELYIKEVLKNNGVAGVVRSVEDVKYLINKKELKQNGFY